MPALIHFEDIEIDVDQRRCVRAGALVRLSRTEWNLPELLARNRGQVLTHRMLLHEVWGEAYSNEINYLHVYIRRLRHKIEANPASPRRLLTEPGIGYRFVVPAAFKPATASSPAPHPPSGDTLPAPLTSFIGRHQELALVSGLLQQADVRLIILTGPGGVGKTRLALEAARQHGRQSPTATCQVSLDSIRSPDLPRARPRPGD